MKILVVDDSAVMRRIHVNLLIEVGIPKGSIFEASDGDEALRLCIENDFNLFLLDWNMPKVNGLDFTKQIREIEKYKTVPIIMVTSEAAKYQVIEAVKAGVTNYVVKPIKHSILIEKIGKYIQIGKKK